jgi:hypothetical protein
MADDRLELLAFVERADDGGDHVHQLEVLTVQIGREQVSPELRGSIALNDRLISSTCSGFMVHAGRAWREKQRGSGQPSTAAPTSTSTAMSMADVRERLRADPSSLTFPAGLDSLLQMSTSGSSASQQHLAVTYHYLRTINRLLGPAGMSNPEIRRSDGRDGVPIAGTSAGITATRASRM